MCSRIINNRPTCPRIKTTGLETKLEHCLPIVHLPGHTFIFPRSYALSTHRTPLCVVFHSWSEVSAEARSSYSTLSRQHPRPRQLAFSQSATSHQLNVKRILPIVLADQLDRVFMLPGTLFHPARQLIMKGRRPSETTDKHDFLLSC